MPTPLLPLGEISPGDENRIGQKAAVLNRLIQAGFPVPPGVCIAVDAFLAATASLAETLQALEPETSQGDPGQVLLAAQKMEALLDGLVLPPTLLKELVRALRSFGDGPFAVRSSAALEDLPGASFAGQYKTVLGVTGEREIEAAVLACWRSYYAPHAVAARARLFGATGVRLSGAGQGMAVLIQPLIDAECSGVCFTVDPVRLRPDLLLVTSTWGLGVGVVDGTVPADTARVRRSDLGINEVVTAEKPERLRPGRLDGEQEGYLSREPVPAEARRSACLPESWLQRVALFGLAVEQMLGCPQDMEWAISGNQAWILQSRPMTALPEDLAAAVRFPVEWADEAELRHFWWRVTIHDGPEAPLLPLEIEFAKARTEGGMAAVEYGGGEKTRWWKYPNGRVYIAVADSNVRPGDRHIRSAALRDLIRRLEQQGVTLWEHWGPEIVLATERLGAFDPQGAGGQALAEHLEDAMAAASRHWMVHTLVPRQGRFQSLVDSYRQMTGKSAAETEEELPFLVQGGETVQTRLLEALYDLALVARKSPPVAALLAARAPGAYARLKDMPYASGFMAVFEKLMADYGGRACIRRSDEHRAALPLPWREAPEHVLDMVAVYLAGAAQPDIPSPRERQERARRESEDYVENLCAQAKDPNAVESFRRHLAYARRNAAFTDEHNHYIDQLAEGQFLQAAIYAGRWLVGRGDLARAEEVYWLSPSEILAALRSPEVQDLEKVIVERQNEHGRWSEQIAPVSLGLPDDGLPERAVESAGRVIDQPESPASPPSLSNTLTGLAVSRGTGRGRARLIPDAAALPEVAPGDVLVAKNAGPLWTPVFAVLSGIVLEEGSAGSHAAITAREFGIPAVFGASGAMAHIPAGARVTVDGAQGLVSWKIGE